MSNISTLNIKYVGNVAVDSGIIFVLDHTHIGVSSSGGIDLPRYNLYAAIKTEVGDGEYEVYEMRDHKGRLKKIIIDID